MEPIRLVILGRPAPEGSKKAMPIYRKGKDGQREFTGHTNLIDEPTTRLADWRQNIHTVARALVRCDCGNPDCTDLKAGFPIDVPVITSMVFAFDRPKAHYRTGRNSHLLSTLGLETPRPIGANIGDWEKLGRAVSDGLQAAGVLRNDRLIVRCSRLEKLWVDDDRTELSVPGAIVWLLPDRPVTRKPAESPAPQSKQEMALW